ncbi:MAG: ADP-ribosylation factor-like protein [Candidatus Thorarchaeota archaeon]
MAYSSYIEYLKEESTEIQKILFTGLDNAGKTSIILALQREFSKIANIEPSRGAQRRIFKYLGHNIAEWDLGGQISYRISYLKNPGKYFDNTEIAIYVIDVQHKDRIPESLSYLKDVVIQFNSLEIEPPIYIFFHKVDPTLIPDDDLDNFLLSLQVKIKELLDYKKLFFHRTSIYDLSSIMTVISEIFLKLYPKANLIQKTMEDFAIKSKADGIELIDENSLIVGSYYKNNVTKDILNQSTPYFLSLNESFQYSEVSAVYLEEKMVIHRYGRYFLFTNFTVRKGSPPYYLLAIREDPDINNEEYLAFVKLLREILNKG